jgi:hypothetical protein
MAGFQFHETMAGSFHLLSAPGEERAMSFTIGARSEPLRKFLRERVVEIEGEVDAEGFADHRYLRGSLGLDLLGTGTLPYAFEFRANDGAAYSFRGKKTIVAGRFLESMTVLPGRILDAGGALFGQALLRFDLRSDLLRFVKSFRRAW